MAYTSSGGVKTATTVRAADTETIGESLDFSIQNQSTEIMYVKLGTGASATDYDFALAACTVAKDGKGGSVSIERYPDNQAITAASVDLKYTFTFNER